jgi:phosphohistidine phosphatase
MKRTLILMRHAKTEDQKPGQRDYDRELLTRGREEAALMAQRLSVIVSAPQQILSSPAKRTQQTSELVCSAFSISLSFVRFESGLYHAPAHRIASEIMATGNEVTTLMVIGHNPGISDFAYDCSKETAIGFATSAIAVFSFEGDWSDLESASLQLTHFSRP